MKNLIRLLFTISTFILTINSYASLIEQFQVYDTDNKDYWSVQENLQEGDMQFGDRTFKLTDIPSTYPGSEWIRTANGSKSFSDDTLLKFYTTENVDVIIALDDRLSVLPWMTDWEDTGENIINDESTPVSFSLYSKNYAKNSWVTLGSVNQSSGASNFTIILYNPEFIQNTPDPFEFDDKFDVEINTRIKSDPEVITGLSSDLGISIENGKYAINNGSFTSDPGVIKNNDQVEVQVNSSSNYSSVSSAQLKIGNEFYDFNVRTLNDPDSGWAGLPAILASITPPEFPDNDFNILDYGAAGDDATDCTEAFKSAISACSDAGGGRVIVPEGTYRTGAIHLLNNVNLHITANAVVKFSTNPDDYLPVVYTRFEGTECYNYSPCIYAFEQTNIAVTGTGTLNGMGSYDNWWAWKSTGGSDVSALRTMADNNVPVEDRVFGSGHYIRPNMIQPYRCTNVLIDSVTIENSPMWHIHPVLSENVTVSNVRVVGHGPNNDGCNPESCTNVRIKNCYFDTGDDCIAIKSGRNADGRRVNVPSSNIIIQECTMKDGHGGVVIGSEISGGANHIFAENCIMDSPNLDRALRIKTNSIRGGLIEKIYMRNIEIGQVSDAIVRINFYYGEGDISTFDPIVRDIDIRNTTCNDAPVGLRFDGYSRSLIRNVKLTNCTFKSISTPFIINNYQNLCLDSVVINSTEYHKIKEPFGESVIQKLIKNNTLGDLNIYPNPLSAGNRIFIDGDIRDIKKIIIRDISGKEMYFNSYDADISGDMIQLIETEAMQPGWYIMSAEYSNHTLSKLFVIE
ncbi:glycoside hydrolase family 28 protein [Saccharicrinis sp. FJH2]|uniref:glycoside hydrolase family 28 protein n=1 Tax=Saccharicrinis sp. FJH65 TaxID=3344659 RepID=UPI0035F272CA